jgi:hypothetical protein
MRAMTTAARAKTPKPNPDRFARVRDHELLDLVQQLEEVDEHLIEGRSYVPDDFIDLTNDAHAVIAKAIAFLCELRERSGGGAP